MSACGFVDSCLCCYFFFFLGILCARLDPTPYTWSGAPSSIQYLQPAPGTLQSREQKQKTETENRNRNRNIWSTRHRTQDQSQLVVPRDPCMVASMQSTVAKSTLPFGASSRHQSSIIIRSSWSWPLYRPPLSWLGPKAMLISPSIVHIRASGMVRLGWLPLLSARIVNFAFSISPSLSCVSLIWCCKIKLVLAICSLVGLD